MALRRLNRSEYNNTVRDLLGTSLEPADSFPVDDSSAGFDTIGDTLSVSPVLAEMFESAAYQLISELVALPATDARRTQVLSCDFKAAADDTCARQILSGFARRAFRRPATTSEIDSLLALSHSVTKLTGAVQDGLVAALDAVLVSPHFIFRVEQDSAPGSIDARPVNDFELATRMSYLAWSSMPDEALFSAAAAGTLTHDRSALDQQFMRLMADPKGSAFAQNFAGQWLYLRFLDTHVASSTSYPAYDDALRSSAPQETQLFFQTLLHDDLPLETLLTANFSMLDARLGKEYGVPLSGPGFLRTSLSGVPRLGLLTQASFLMVTSHPDSTSPVKRGAWVLSQLLCSTPPAPPADVPAFVAPTPGDKKTVRDQLALHRASPQCSTCHNLMDPIGLAFENYDGIGSYRAMDNGSPVDARGTVPGTSTAFSGALELAPLLARDPRFAGCVAQQLLTYAVGRSFSASDAQAYASALAHQAVAQGKGGWRGMLQAVVDSDAFTTRRGELP